MTITELREILWNVGSTFTRWEIGKRHNYQVEQRRDQHLAAIDAAMPILGNLRVAESVSCLGAVATRLPSGAIVIYGDVLDSELLDRLVANQPDPLGSACVESVEAGEFPWLAPAIAAIDSKVA